ncbi:MAG: M1 family metallopeptidase [Nitrospiria bacterium]
MKPDAKRLIRITMNILVLLLWPAVTLGHSILHHELSVSIFPERHLLKQSDTIKIMVDRREPIQFRINRSLELERITDLRDKPLKYEDTEVSDSETGEPIRLVTIPLPENPVGEVSLTIRLHGTFQKMPDPKTFDFRRTGEQSISYIDPEGSFLDPAGFWYPQVPGQKRLHSFRMRVNLPTGQEAMAPGNRMKRRVTSEGTVALFDYPHPAEGMTLIAGPYRISEERFGSIALLTYFLKGEEELVPRYMKAMKRHLEHYIREIGPYPFRQFSVVSNRLPTGFGFPAFTLLGSAVLRLPFIPMGSLRHEILHNWWGNGVYADYESGNWAEGLTMYQAEYAGMVARGEKVASEGRLWMLRNYAAYATEGEEVSIVAFRERDNSALRAIGYDKVAMIFQMLEGWIGHETLTKAIRKVAATRMFQKTSWRDWQQAIEEASGEELDWFFRQWLERPGAPKIRLEEVRQISQEGSTRVAFTLMQEDPPYRLRLPVLIETDQGETRRNLWFEARRTHFEIAVPGRAKFLAIDPDYRLFRRLHREETPPLLGEIVSSKAVSVVLPSKIDPDRLAAYHDLLPKLFEHPFQVIKNLGKAKGPLVFFGTPDENPVLTERLPEKATWQWKEGKWALKEDRFGDSGDMVALTWRGSDEAHPTLWIFGFSASAIRAATRPLPHYGSYSYLGFRGGKNRLKGVWPITDTPLQFHFSEERP